MRPRALLHAIGGRLCQATRCAPMVALLGVGYAPAPVTAAPAPVIATVDEPRAFGHVLGDVLTQRVLLQANGADLGSVSPPSVGRTGLWLERRPASVETDANGRRWMVIDYQIVNAPQTLTRIALPALTLGAANGTQLQVAEWPASVGPLTPADVFGDGDLQPMRPDRMAPPVDTDGLYRRLGWSLGLLFATLAAWAGWWCWRNWREAQRLPFARAWRQLRQMRRFDRANGGRGAGGAQGAASPDAWFCMHRALNETAGEVVHAGSLAGLIARAPYLQPLRAQLDHFYRMSAERFFKPTPGAADFPLEALCRALYQAERRHQR
ncbi:mxaA protein [Paraburkholderia sp. GAS333]|uniref:calcium incorporation protein MxaA n=1 Tax=Paraburkholderia sp. GAS333 TaxID=3156279 RepID=UPI003D25F51F